MSLPNANVVTENGEQFIPASQRPDGTWRKARRVKEGYVPQEEVPLYESKGKQILNRKNDPVVLSTGQVVKKSPIPGLYIVDVDQDKKKVQKKKTDLDKSLSDLKLSDAPKQKATKTPKKEDKVAQEAPEAADPQKKLKNLKKRLREVEALEEKIKNGSLAKPEPEQLAKVKRKNDLIFQIHDLEKLLQ